MRATHTIAAAATLALLACKGGESKLRPGEVTTADVIAGSAAAYEHFESASGHFALDLPVAWRSNFTVSEHADSVAGSLYTVEFIYHPAPPSKQPPKTLMAIRLFSTTAWDQLAARSGAPIAAKVATKGDVVYALSLPPGNPYPKGTPDAALFDKLVIGVAGDPAGIRLTPK